MQIDGKFVVKGKIQMLGISSWNPVLWLHVSPEQKKLSRLTTKPIIAWLNNQLVRLP